jgi:hypothetical protein
MANGTTRLALSKMQIDGKNCGQCEYMEEITIEGDKKQQSKIPLKNPSEHNHSK